MEGYLAFRREQLEMQSRARTRRPAHVDFRTESLPVLRHAASPPQSRQEVPLVLFFHDEYVLECPS
jgi:hypothetical protein